MIYQKALISYLRVFSINIVKLDVAGREPLKHYILREQHKSYSAIFMLQHITVRRGVTNPVRISNFLFFSNCPIIINIFMLH